MVDAAPKLPTCGAAFTAEDVIVRVSEREILSDVCLRIDRSERVALIGPSGAGKSTLLRLFAGLIWPSAGRVCALGQDTSALRGPALRQLRRQIGFLQQDGSLTEGLRVAHNVLAGNLGRWSRAKALRSLIWPARKDLAEARASLERVELGERLWSMPAELSGGERQRVSIARLFVQQPDAVLADEPVSALDIRLGREVIERLADLTTDRDVGLVVSLHSLDLLDQKFSRVIALQAGRVFWDGPPEALTQDLLLKLYGAEYRALHLDEISLGSRRLGP